jgi:hypothetical protein
MVKATPLSDADWLIDVDYLMTLYWLSSLSSDECNIVGYLY